MNSGSRAAEKCPRGRGGAIAFLLASALAPALASGCAKDPTVIDVHVSADDTVPPLMILRSKIARNADPATVIPAEVGSHFSSDAADRPGAFPFPLVLPVAVPSGWSGPVNLTVEGLLWETGQVIATGSTAATATREKTTEAMLTLVGVRGGQAGPDAGPDGAGEEDAGTDATVDPGGG